ncbi:MAG TPA: pyridoxal phosphate-dependent aminotransferase [Thermomicrobiaceae bacterium]|nr:pyridoxal phosphate-dependent aminotransferase [Thermomicrobiaceae bacterium]
MASPADRGAPQDGASRSINIFELQELARSKRGVISMGLGDPDLPTPAHIVEAAKRAIAEGRTGPAPTRGLPELRQAIARKLARDNDIVANPDTEVLVTTGGQEALFLVIQALIEPGDEVLVPDPRYTSYDEAIELAGGRIVLVPTDEQHDFDLDPDEVERRITPRSKVLLLISPNNPTAGIVSPDNVRRLAELVIRHDLVVISDEIYEKFLYDGATQISIGSLPGMRERTITLNGASKTYAMTGWRIGYVCGPPEFIDAVAALKEMVNVQAPTVSQWAAAAGLDGPQECVEEMRRIYAERRRLLLDALDEMGFSYGTPHGALYVWANTASTGFEATELSYLFLQEAGVLIFPGTGFGENWGSYMRMTLLQPKEVLAQAVEQMKAALSRHRAGSGTPARRP